MLFLLGLAMGCGRHPLEPCNPNQPVQVLHRQAGTVEATLTVEDPPLTIGEEQMTVALVRSGKPLNATQPPEMDATFLRDKAHAPLEVIPQSRPGVYTIKAVFLLPGTWQLAIQPGPSAPSIRFNLSVEASPEPTGSE